MFDSQLMASLEKVRRCGLVGEDVSLQAGFEVSKLMPGPVSLPRSLPLSPISLCLQLVGQM